MFIFTAMSPQSERLERLITRELGECCTADVTQRLTYLEDLFEKVPDGIDRDVGLLKVLGNDTRYTIVRLLHSADDELCVCEITPVIDVSDSAVSHALSDLYEAGVVIRRKEGTWRYYRLAPGIGRILEAVDGHLGPDR